MLSRKARQAALEIEVIERDGEAQGIVIAQFDVPGRSEGLIEIVALPPTAARRGTGVLGATLVEDRMQAQGVTAIYAPVADVHGISMYFWIRLGYRPLLRADWPCAVDGVVWLRRDI
jgi:hypothetical protein